jgi:hypothetical protein
VVAVVDLTIQVLVVENLEAEELVVLEVLLH